MLVHLDNTSPEYHRRFGLCLEAQNDVEMSLLERVSDWCDKTFTNDECFTEVLRNRPDETKLLRLEIYADLPVITKALNKVVDEGRQ